MKKANKRKASPSEPSAASLREIPRVDFERGKVRRNPYAERIAREGIEIVLPGKKPRKLVVRTSRGRPRGAVAKAATTPRSVRFPDDVWRALEKRAQKEGVTLHAALRKAIVEWLKRAA